MGDQILQPEQLFDSSQILNYTNPCGCVALHAGVNRSVRMPGAPESQTAG